MRNPLTTLCRCRERVSIYGVFPDGMGVFSYCRRLYTTAAITWMKMMRNTIAIG